MNRYPLGHGAALAAVLVAGLLATAGPATALEPPGRLAEVSVFSTGVDFRPEVEYHRAIITVSGRDVDYRMEFAPGETPFLDVFGAGGEVLPDGVYQWELQLLLEGEARRELMIATTKNDGETTSARARQSGAFTVVGGFIADPGLEEAQSGRSAGDWAGLGSPASEPLVLGGLAPRERTAEDSDAVSDLCEARASLRSASCEAAALASPGNPAVDRLAGGFLVPNRTGLGDSDSEVAAGGLAAAEFVFTPSAETTEATQPRRFFDPEGANGRPRSEEEQR